MGFISLKGNVKAKSNKYTNIKNIHSGFLSELYMSYPRCWNLFPQKRILTFGRPCKVHSKTWSRWKQSYGIPMKSESLLITIGLGKSDQIMRSLSSLCFCFFKLNVLDFLKCTQFGGRGRGTKVKKRRIEKDILMIYLYTLYTLIKSDHIVQKQGYLEWV